MIIKREEQYLGNVSDEVPRIEPDEQCNGKKIEQDSSGRTIFSGYCNAKAGKGTHHVGQGRCKHHGGCSTGAPKGNQNAQTHAMHADPQHYFQSLPDEEKEYIRNVAASIHGRIQVTDDEGNHPDRVVARRIAIKLHTTGKASNHLKNLSEKTEINEKSLQKQATLLNKIRKREESIFRALNEKGAMGNRRNQKLLFLMNGEPVESSQNRD
jgi:hypothetical protein